MTGTQVHYNQRGQGQGLDSLECMSARGIRCGTALGIWPWSQHGHGTPSPPHCACLRASPRPAPPQAHAHWRRLRLRLLSLAHKDTCIIYQLDLLQPASGDMQQQQSTAVSSSPGGVSPISHGPSLRDVQVSNDGASAAIEGSGQLGGASQQQQLRSLLLKGAHGACMHGHAWAAAGLKQVCCRCMCLTSVHSPAWLGLPQSQLADVHVGILGLLLQTRAAHTCVHGRVCVSRARTPDVRMQQLTRKPAMHAAYTNVCCAAASHDGPTHPTLQLAALLSREVLATAGSQAHHHQQQDAAPSQVAAAQRQGCAQPDAAPLPQPAAMPAAGSMAGAAAGGLLAVAMHQLPHLLQRLAVVEEHVRAPQSSHGPPITGIQPQGAGQPVVGQGNAGVGGALSAAVMQQLDALAMAVGRLEGSMAEHLRLLRSMDVRLCGLEHRTLPHTHSTHATE